MNLRHVRNAALLLACAASPLMAKAAGAGYNFLEASYMYRDAYDQSGSGIRIAGSMNVLQPLAAFASFKTSNDLSQYGFGGLFHMPMARNIDLIAGASFEHVDTGTDSDDGLGLRAGVSWLAMPRLQLTPEIRFVTAHQEVTSLRVNALYSLAPSFDVQGAAQVGDDDRFEVGLRYDFGARY